jgi:ParB family protein of integrating conjugative element (PFGI_1 class)
MAPKHQRPTPAQLMAETEAVLSREVKNPADLEGEETSLISLRVADVVPYGNNPRQQDNPNFESIKSSIRERGLDSMLTVVKIPGDNFYTVAKGGKTRLFGLQDLALEPGGDRFIEQNFLLKKFTSHSELQAAHLVENIARADMSFWDTARSIVLMRDTLAKEMGKPLSQPEFAQLLKSKGVVVDVLLAPDCIFTVNEFSGLGKLAQGLARRHVRDTLRPAFTSLNTFWCKHPGRTAAEFTEVHRSWVASYAGTTDEYDLDVLQAHIQVEAAAALNYRANLFTACIKLSAKDEHKKASVEELIELSSAASSYAAAAASSAGMAAKASPTDDPEFQLDGKAEELSPELALLSQRLSTKGGLAAMRGGDQLPDPSLSNGNDDDGSGNGNDDDDDSHVDSKIGFAGVPGLQVATGLTPRLPKSTTAATTDQSPAGQGSPSAAQNSLPGVVSSDAEVQLSPDATSWQAIQHVADTAGILSLLKPCEVLPAKFFVDLPQAGFLGDSSTDIAVEAWWLLAAISGQIVLSLAEIMPESDFKSAFLNVDEWDQTLAEQLGGVMLIDSAWLVDILINTNHALSQPLHALLSALRAQDAATKLGESS